MKIRINKRVSCRKQTRVSIGDWLCKMFLSPSLITKNLVPVSHTVRSQVKGSKI